MRCHLLIFYQLLCFQFISITFSSSLVTHLCSQTQSAILIQFKTNFSINKTASKDCVNSPIPKTNSWKKAIDCCLWDGVSCDNITGQVTGLDLSCSCLSGTFPSNSTFFLLSHLQRLDLSYNDFKNSEIPSKFGLFPSLTHLDLSCSWFSGPVPYEISYLSKLVSLHLSYRSIIDLIGISIQAPGQVLRLEKSTLNGIVMNMTRVTEISLDGIDMSSIDPFSFMNLSYSLTTLSLYSCHLRGNFPENIFKLPNIEFLMLDDNTDLTGQFPKSNWSSPLVVLSASLTSLSGELPESLGNLKSLLILGLVSCNLSGSIPRSIGNLSQLTALFISYNYFSGQIPSSITNLTKLTMLSLSDNHLEGSIPDGNPNAFPNLATLDLSDNSLTGTTPSWLYTVPSLISLDLGNNQFIGPINEFQSRSLEMMILKNNRFSGLIPSSISKLVNLTFLDLSSNFIEGHLPILPPNIEFLSVSSNNLSGKVPILPPNIRFLSVSNNNLSGKVPILPPNIEFLSVSNNNLSGKVPILPPNIRFLSVSTNNLSGKFPDICNAKFIEILDLSRNHFSGVIPQCIGSFLQSLSSLNVKMNKFHGSIPSSFAKRCALKNLNLNSNHLQGPLTRSITNCRGLEVLDLGNNRVNDTFPHWIQALPELQVLVLRSNKFQGSIQVPKSRRSLAKLRILDLSYNKFTGPLPTSYIRGFKGMMNIVEDGKAATYMGETNFSYDYSVGLAVKGLEIEMEKILTIFTSIDLSSNNFEGEIPRVIGELSSLRGLNLSHNNLYGHVQASLGNLSLLEWLDLSSNNFVGQIPIELLDLSFLSSFNVSYNQLVGPIPQGKQFNTFENGSYQGNEGLCGFPLSRGCNNNESRQPPAAPLMNVHNDDDSMFEFGWKVIAIGYGFGFVFGAAMGYFCVQTGKPKWFVTLYEAPRRRR